MDIDAQDLLSVGSTETEVAEANATDSDSSCSSCDTEEDEWKPEGILFSESHSGKRLSADGIPKLTDMVWNTTNPILRPFTVIQRIYPCWEVDQVTLPPLAKGREQCASLPILSASEW